MHRHMCDCTKPPEEFHTNLFIDIERYPYLLADYFDRNNIQQIDKSMIRSFIETDQSEPMRAIIDISIDDVGKKSDGSLSTLGNNTKQVNLVEMINRNFSRLKNRLPVLRKGIIVRIHYRLENYRTGQTIKSTSEDFRIPHANYFLDINPKNVNDNGVIVNFTGSSVSGIDYFTYGRDKMVLKITSVELFYEYVENGPYRPVGKEYLAGSCEKIMPTYYGDEIDQIEYQRRMDNPNDPYHHGYGNEPIETITPPSWALFNHYYHFDNDGKDIIIHRDEVYDKRIEPKKIPCGSVIVNRSIVVNPCHRILFKFCIWKNDTTVVNDTRMIAAALRASVRNPYYDIPSEMYPIGGVIDCDCPGHYNPHNPYKPPIVPDYESLLRMYQSGKAMDYDQNAVINQLSALIGELTDTINDLKGNSGDDGDDSETPEIPTLPEAPPEKPCRPPHHNHKPDVIKEMMCMIKSLQDQINDLKGDKDPEDPGDTPSDGNCNCGDKYVPMQPDDIKDAVNGAMDETDPDKNKL